MSFRVQERQLRTQYRTRFWVDLSISAEERKQPNNILIINVVVVIIIISSSSSFVYFFFLSDTIFEVDREVKIKTYLLPLLILWSDYRKSLLGQFIRIRLYIEQNCRLFLDIFTSAIMNDLLMTFTSRLKVDAKCVYKQ